MIAHVIDSVPLDANWVFVVQREHREQYDLDNVLQGLKPGCTVIDTGGGVTEGAACTVLLAGPYIHPVEPLIVINSDNILRWDINLLDDVVTNPIDGAILCFEDPTRNPRWSYVKRNVRGHVTEVAEKNPISDFATAGLYMWAFGDSFLDAAQQMIDKNIRTNGEFYLAPVFNQNIARGETVIVDLVREMHDVGTPESLEAYIQRGLAQS